LINSDFYIVTEKCPFKKKKESWFPQKYEGAQLFSTLIQNVS